jgi:hypothetical protein
MSNGFSNEEMIKMILDGQGKIQLQIDGLVAKVDKIMVKGCAHREDDLRRIEELEGWRTKGIIGVITLAIGTIATFLSGHK